MSFMGGGGGVFHWGHLVGNYGFLEGQKQFFIESVLVSFGFLAFRGGSAKY